MFSVHRAGIVVTVGVLIAAVAAPAHAQLNNQHVRGSVGVKSGSQAPVGEYFTLPLLYTYSTDDIRNRDGDRVPINADITAALFGAGVTIVTKKTILGANYGFSV